VVLQKQNLKDQNSLTAYVTPVGSDDKNGPIQTITMDFKSILNGQETKGPVEFHFVGARARKADEAEADDCEFLVLTL
jgi:hypothetical protein